MRSSLCIICVLLAGLCATPVFAAITWSGSYSPTTAWTGGTTGYVGYQGDGSMTVDTGSTQSSSTAFIGGSSGYTGVTGTATVSGSGSRWTNTNNMYVGYYATGNLNVNGGAAVSDFTGSIGHQAGSTGTANIDGLSSMWGHTASTSSGSVDGLYVGYFGNGTMNVTNGAKVTNTNNAPNYIAYQTGSTGTVNVDGQNSGTHSQWDTGSGNSKPLYVGYRGAGYLNVTNGGVVSDNTGYVGGSSGTTGTGTAIVDGSGGGLASKWVNTAGLYVGANGAGSLTVRNGGQVTSGASSASLVVGAYASGNGVVNVNTGGTMTTGTAYIGSNTNYPSARGEVTVDGANSSWTLTGSAAQGTLLYIGPYASGSGYGKLHITNGATVNNTYICTSGSSPPPAFSGTTYIGAIASVSGVGNGTLDFGPSGGTLNTRTLYGSPNQMTGTGTINANGLVSDTTVTFNASSGLTPSNAWTASDGGTVTVHLDMSNAANNGVLGAGYAGTGTLNILQGQQVTSSAGELGYKPGSTGTATVSGAGSKWIGSSNGRQWIVGRYGNGTLNVNGGAAFDLSGTGYGNLYLGYSATAATGTVNLDGAGTTASVYSVMNAYYGKGYLNITNGAVLNSTVSGGTTNWLGYLSGSVGNAVVDGAGSSWTGWQFYSGSGGLGKMKITNGGVVNATLGFKTSNAGSYVAVDGAGSQLNIGTVSTAYDNGVAGGAAVYVSGGGALNVTNSNAYTIYDSSSLLQVDAGRGSSVTVSNGGITNNGTVRVVCGASPAASNTYTPISVSGSPWAGSGTVQAVGGTWSFGTFTASTVATGAAGSPVSIDANSQQRILIADAGSGKSLGASFLSTIFSTPISLTASTLSGSAATSLAAASGQQVLTGWECSSTGYTAGDPVYLSLATGASPYALTYWSFDGSAWSALAANDATRDSTYASLTATALNGYSYALTVAAMSGDATLDGKVDISDLGKVLTNYNKTGLQWTDGDFDGNGTADISDLGKVLTSYNKTAGAFAHDVRAVPEPGTLTLLAAGLAVLVALVRRVRK